MAVFSRYNPRGVGRGSVLLQAHPNAEPVPWKPHATVTRTDPNWGGAGRVHRVGPHERAGLFKPTNSQLGTWVNGNFDSSGVAAAPSMSSGCGGGCGGCGGCQGMPLANGVNKGAK
jgi:hypothetical protein